MLDYIFVRCHVSHCGQNKCFRIFTGFSSSYFLVSRSPNTHKYSPEARFQFGKIVDFYLNNSFFLLVLNRRIALNSKSDRLELLIKRVKFISVWCIKLFSPDFRGMVFSRLLHFWVNIKACEPTVWEFHVDSTFFWKN